MKVWIAGEVLSASDQNAEFNNIVNNGEDLGWPATKAKDLDGQELILDSDADTSITADSDDVIDVRIGGVDGLFFGHGTGNTVGFVHVDPGAFTATANTNIGLIRVGNTNAVTVPAGTTTIAAGLFLEIPNWTATGTITKSATLYIEGGATEGTDDYALLVDAGITRFDGTTFVNELANTLMGLGLTINQGANDDEILALKSSDVSHVMTALAEDDTYGTLSKSSAAAGGLEIRGYRDSSQSANSALVLRGRQGAAADTTDTTSSIAVVDITGQITDGSTGVTGLAAAGNLLSIRNSGTTRVLVKGNGALHITNVIDIAASTGTDVSVAIALDAEDDVALVRAYQRTIYNDAGIAMTKWDDAVKANKDDLKRLGVLSSEGDFTCVQRMNSLLGGAIWQLHTRLMEVQERLISTEHKLCQIGEYDG